MWDELCRLNCSYDRIMKGNKPGRDIPKPQPEPVKKYLSPGEACPFCGGSVHDVGTYLKCGHCTNDFKKI